jgi:hypothetical protein
MTQHASDEKQAAVDVASVKSRMGDFLGFLKVSISKRSRHSKQDKD